MTFCLLSQNYRQYCLACNWKLTVINNIYKWVQIKTLHHLTCSICVLDYNQASPFNPIKKGFSKANPWRTNGWDLYAIRCRALWFVRVVCYPSYYKNKGAIWNLRRSSWSPTQRSWAKQEAITAFRSISELPLEMMKQLEDNTKTLKMLTEVNRLMATNWAVINHVHLSTVTISQSKQ